jgi:hypothetical protein
VNDFGYSHDRGNFITTVPHDSLYVAYNHGAILSCRSSFITTVQHDPVEVAS